MKLLSVTPASALLVLVLAAAAALADDTYIMKPLPGKTGSDVAFIAAITPCQYA